MEPADIWAQIEKNVQEVAEKEDLVQPGQAFALTPDQSRAIGQLEDRLSAGCRRLLLKAPTGSGKTEVLLRVAVQRVLETGKHVVVVVPTRDLARQEDKYFEDRLRDTGLQVREMHGGVPPGQRNQTLEDLKKGKVHFVIGSAMLMHHSRYRPLLESAALVIVDDVNAFDEEEDLSHLRGLSTPILFSSATPEAVERFLRREGAWEHTVEMKASPFESPPTRVHEIEAHWNENIFNQLDMGLDILRRHLESGSRIYVISRTRARVPVIAQYLQDRTGVPVSMLHGEMADTREHQKRLRRAGTRAVAEDRVSMMKQFRENSPAVLVATNLVGSGLDIPMADMVLVTDADHFGPAEIEQLLGRVGRRERPSDAVLIKGTTSPRGAVAPRIKTSSYVRKGKVVVVIRPMPGRRRGGRKKAV
ncbi:MAG TPA: helicase-related protein [Candidatus Nitrosotenuis sp.]|nr:helicase-related protein [Candidatus Nitrosotenuis sp.]